MKIFDALVTCSLLTSVLGIYTVEARASTVGNWTDPSAIDQALSRFANMPSSVQAEARAKLQKAQAVLTSLCAKDQSNMSSCAYLAAVMKLDEYRKTARHLSHSLYLRTNGASQYADAFTVFGTSFVAGEAGTALAFGALGTAAFQSAGFGAVFAIVSFEELAQLGNLRLKMAIKDLARGYLQADDGYDQHRYEE